MLDVNSWFLTTV